MGDSFLTRLDLSRDRLDLPALTRDSRLVEVFYDACGSSNEIACYIARNLF